MQILNITMKFNNFEMIWNFEILELSSAHACRMQSVKHVLKHNINYPTKKTFHFSKVTN